MKFQKQFCLLFFSLLAAQLAAQHHADFKNAIDVCKKGVVHVESARGEGRNPNEALDIPCFEGSERRGNAEKNSVWLRWKIKKDGSFFFAITPHRFDDDLDFVVFRLPGGKIDDKIIVRCMASGDIDWAESPCMGETGLRSADRDNFEDAGCADYGDNAWLAPLQTREGEEYALLVSNVTSSGPGFSIRFGGSALLPCEEETKKVKPIPKKEVPKPEPKPEPPVAVKPRELPKEVAGRPVFSQKTLEVASSKLSISVFDDQVVDGDAISIWVNEKKVVNWVNLKKEPQVFFVDIESGENYLTIHAEEFGLAKINTTAVIIDDGKTKQTLHLLAKPGEEESLKVIWK